MPFLLAEILNFQGSTHRTGVGSFSYHYYKCDYHHLTRKENLRFSYNT